VVSGLCSVEGVGNVVTSDQENGLVDKVSKQQRYREKQGKEMKQKALYLSKRACEVLDLFAGVDGMNQSQIASLIIEAAGDVLEHGNPVIWSGVIKQLRDRLV